MTSCQSTIAVLAVEYVDYQKVLIDSIAAENRRRGYGTLCLTSRELDTFKTAEHSHCLGGRLYPVLQASGVAGLISVNGAVGNNVCVDALSEFVHRFSVPKVTIGIGVPGITNVNVDDESVMFDLVKHLIMESKARRIAFVQGTPGDPYSEQRERIYRKAMSDAGYVVDESHVVRGNYDSFETYQVVYDLLHRCGSQIDAIVAASDGMALSAARAITSLGFDIPGDIAITGFDDTGEATRHSPALTTVRQPIAQIAKRSVVQLIAQIELKSQLVSPEIVVSSELVVRGSTTVGMRNREHPPEANGCPDYLHDQIVASMAGLCTPANVNMKAITDGLFHTLAGGEDHLSCILDKSLIDSIQADQQHWWSNLCHQIESYSEKCLHALPEKRFMPIVVYALSGVKERIWALAMEREFEIGRVRSAHANMHLQMSSCTKHGDILATISEWLENIKPRRWYLVWYDKPQGAPHDRARLVQVFSNGKSVEFSQITFDSVDVLPAELTDELKDGLLVLSPITAGGIHFGYLLIDPEGAKSVDIGCASVSIGNAMRSRYLMSRIKQKTSDLEQANTELSQLAKFDALTGLPNRWHFHQMLQKAFLHSGNDDVTLGVLFVDLDGFKIVNDTLGHDAGDNLLKIIADRLSHAVDKIDRRGLVARLGGDEFTVIVQLEQRVGERAINDLASTLLKLVTQPCDIDGQSVVVSASIGYSLNTPSVSDAEALLNQADRAMYRAKANGRNGIVPYTPALESANLQRLKIEQNLRVALKNGDLQVHFQPRIDLNTGLICGAEALMRWIVQGDDGPVVVAYPDEFIPVAEQTGLIKELDALALEQCLMQLKAWEKSGINITVSINVSVACLQQESFVGDVLACIKSHAIKPSSVELEITESAAMADVEDNFAKLDSFKKAGVRLSIDDFGTGYSSLSYLKKFPVDHLKIDRSFIMEITKENYKNATETAVVRSIVALGKSLQIGLVAEGVEDELQLDFVKSLGCDEGQGYFFYKPMPAAELTVILSQEAEQFNQRAA